MATTKQKTQKEVRNENIEATVSKTEQFFNENQKTIWGVLAAILVVGLAILAYGKFVYSPKCAEAMAAMYPAEASFQAGEFELALSGDGNVPGFEQVIEEYGAKAGKSVYMYAGICELQLGNFESALSYLKKYKGRDAILAARAIACLFAAACNDLYLDKPGDDTTVAAIKLRERLDVSLMVGPPVNKESDNYYVEQFMSRPGKKVVCGGTSSQIVARYLGKRVKTSFEFPDREVPPIGFIEGIDLATEGVITLRRLLELSEKYISLNDLTPKTFNKKDGASLLANVLFEEATHITFFVGQGVNAAHQGLPIDITMKLKLVEHLAQNLRAMGKEVVLNYH